MLMFQRRERPVFSVESLAGGGGGTARIVEWVALAPHLREEVLLEPGDLELLIQLPPNRGASFEKLCELGGSERLGRLVEAGLLIGDHDAHAELRVREALLADTHWWTPAAVAHVFGKWKAIDVVKDEAEKGNRSFDALIGSHGSPPAETIEVRPPETWVLLPAPGRTALDALLEKRLTCRNFDSSDEFSLEQLSAILKKVFGAQAQQALGPGAVALKKNSPSGGGLHPIEAFLLIRNVHGLERGSYHYHPTAHALVPMQRMTKEEADGNARELVAGQYWFADASVLVVLAARFERTFWKYRNHPKAWRVIHLDAGHLSQNLYLAATELGHGAFITGAMNDETAERLFDLDGIATAAIATCGFGKRGGTAHFEFDLA